MTDAGPPPPGVVARRDEPLARHVPCRVGGPCDLYVVVQRREALAAADAWLRDTGLARKVLGSGSRILPRDGGLAGAVIRLGRGFRGVVEEADGWWVGAATPLAVLAHVIGGPLAALRHCPGTVGASVALDEGWAPWVDRAWVWSRGDERERTWDRLDGRSALTFTAVHLRAGVTAPAPGPTAPGSWFEPIEDEDVVRLLRETALAGTRLRGVSLPAHAPDRVVNLGEGTAKDVEQLLRGVVDKVHQHRGVKLQVRQQTWGRVS